MTIQVESTERPERAVAPRPGWLPQAVSDGLKRSMQHIATLLPPDIPVDHFRAALMLHLPRVINLQRAKPESIVSAIVKMAIEGMLPERDAVIVVFKDKAERLVMYQGLLRALDRTGKVLKPSAECVYSNDTFDIDLGNDTVSHKPPRGGPRGHMIGAYARIVLKNGTTQVHWMDLDDLNRVRQVALGRDQDAWIKHPTEMYRKTVLKNACKYVRLTDTVDDMLADEEARPEESAVVIENGRKATADLFGDETATYHPGSAHPAQMDEAMDVETGEIRDSHWAEGDEDAPSAQATAPANEDLQYEPTPPMPPTAAEGDAPEWKRLSVTLLDAAREALAAFPSSGQQSAQRPLDNLRRAIGELERLCQERTSPEAPRTWQGRYDSVAQRMEELKAVVAIQEGESRGDT